MKFKISEIQANPFRHIDRYPIRQDKVAALRESLRTTGFWDNVVARLVGGKPEIAYGHHRLFALREEYKPGHEVNLIIRVLSDDAMLKIMARENMQEWGTSAAIEQETVRAVIEAYAEGKIDLPVPAAKQGVRYAPSFSQRSRGRPLDQPSKPYTAEGVANFLGWLERSGRPQKKVVSTLAALEFIEDGVLSDSDFDGLTTSQADAVVSEARKAKAGAEAAARQERERAEQAKRAAAEAERQRQFAEYERKQRAFAAAAAREKDERERAEKEAAAAARRAAEFERQRETATRRQAEAEQRQREERERGRQQAASTGRHVSAGLKSGRGVVDAGKLAEQVRPKRDDPPPPHIDKYALDLAAKLGRILDPDYDVRTKELDVLLRFHSEMKASSLRELLAALGRIEERAASYRARLGGTDESNDNTIDAEVIEDRPALARRHTK